MQAALDLLDEPGLLALALRHGEARHQVRALGEGGLAPLGDQQGVVAGLGQLAPDLAHLGRRLEVEVVGLELEPLRVGQGGAGLDAEQHRVRLGVLGAGVVQVVGGHQRQTEVLGEPEQVGAHPLLDRQVVVHQLAVVVLRAEDVAELRRRLPRRLVLAEPQPGVHLTAGASGGGDQALAVPSEQLAVHPRLVEVALEAGQGGHPEQVVHPGRGAGQQGEVGVGAAAGDVVLAGLAPAHPGAVEPAGAGSQVSLHPDDRLDAVLARLLPELVGAEHEPVVGGGQRGHAHPGGLGEEIVDLGRAVEHRVLGVRVQVNEGVGSRRPTRRHAAVLSTWLRHVAGGSRCSAPRSGED